MISQASCACPRCCPRTRSRCGSRWRLPSRAGLSRGIRALLGAVLLIAGCAPSDPQESTAPPLPSPELPQVLVAAGDIAACNSDGDEATAALLARIPGTVATLGDNVYPDGTSEEFRDCYDPTWGRHLSRTRPAPGNHDYDTRDARGYFGYFGNRAGERGRGWYSYEIGPFWHVIVLNSNCEHVGGCDRGSPQERWLREDLAAHRDRHVLAYWHHARFSSGRHGSSRDTEDLWEALHEHGAELVLVGHDHSYERFAPLGANGEVDRDRGVRQFVVGTGGRSHYRFPGPPLPGTEARNDDTFGLLVLRLHAAGYEWEFVPAADGTFTDRGWGPVH